MKRFLFRKQTKTNAQAYYRTEVPIRVITRTIPDAKTFLAAEWECRTAQELDAYYQAAATMDALVYFAVGGKVVDTLLRILKATEYRRPIYIPDLDDNIDYCNPTNERFAHLGTRLPDGTSLRGLLREKPEDQVIRIGLPDGSFRVLWKNGENEFDIKRNLKGVRALNRSLRRADMCAFTTARLAGYYKATYKLPKVYPFPNSVLFEDYPDFAVKRKVPGTIRVMWQGGSSHYVDLYPMRETLAKASEMFPEIKWVIWGGQDFAWAWEGIPKDRIEFHQTVPYNAYRLKLASMDFDIALAPLVDNIFNVGKSCIKWYEATALNPPKPCLLSRVPPYTDEATSDTAVFFDMPRSTEEVSGSFLEGLEKLVRDAKERERIASNARDWLQEKRDAFKTVPKFVKAMEEVHERINEGLEPGPWEEDL